MKYFEKINQVMRASGDLVFTYFQQGVASEHKADGSIVTVADVENEQFLKKELAKIVPSAGFYAEESGQENIDQDYVWVIDPIDGTRNFARGISHFCISVALTYKGDPVVAAVYHPALQNLYYAESGQGAWLNGTKQLRISDQQYQHGALVVIDDMRAKQIDLLKGAENVFGQKHVSVRFLGSAALDAAYVAAGSIDLLMYEGLGWWDAAAGVLLVEEAGGVVTQFDRSLVRADYTSFLAGEKNMHEKFLPVVEGKICN